MAGKEIELHRGGDSIDHLLAGMRVVAEASEPLSPDYDFQTRYEIGYSGRPTNPGPPYSVVCIDEVAKDGARRMAASLESRYGEHLILTGRPLPFHPAKVVYYIDDERVEPSREPLLPSGFEISRWATNMNIAANDALLAMSIAYGAHGLGPHYFSSPEKPLHLVGITTNKNVGRVKEELTKIKAASKGKVPFVRTTLIRTPH